MILTETQLDLLKEAFNIGVGQAAYALSELVGGEEIVLAVPLVELKSVLELEREILETGGDRVCGVSEAFAGVFSGRALMLYSHAESLELVRLMLRETIPLEHFSEMEGEAICEVGNIVLNACISTLANLIGIEIQTEVPMLHMGTPSEVLACTLGTNERRVLHLRMSFVFYKHQLSGHIGFMLEMSAVHRLAEELDRYFSRMLES